MDGPEDRIVRRTAAGRSHLLVTPDYLREGVASEDEEAARLRFELRQRRFASMRRS